MMKKNKNIFLGKKILIYGLGKSGISSYKFLKNKSKVYLFDDYQKKNLIYNQKKRSHKEISKINFDFIIISPGIDISKCKLSKFLKKNNSRIYTDLDVFYEFFKNKSITITGTNGKSTTCQLLYEVMTNQKIDVKLVGNIGNPILSEKKIKKNTIFVIEASSYQLEYSKIFKTNYAAILNISPDHIERHKSIKNYVKEKFKLLKNQSKNNWAFLKKNDHYIEREIKFKNFNTKIIKVGNQQTIKFLKKLNNNYFSNNANIENLSFVIAISKKLGCNFNSIKKAVSKFKGLKFRQQVIFKSKNLTIINDSKSTSFSSTISLLKTKKNIFWLLGGIPKKGDKFDLNKKYFKNIKGYIFGRNKKFFNSELKRKIKFENFLNLKDALKRVFQVIKKDNSIDKTILFSPSAASFDFFKNFEERGFYFNKLIKKHLNGF